MKQRGLTDWDVDKKGTLPVNIREPNQPQNIYSDSTFSLNCANCYVQGSFVIEGHLSVTHFVHITDLWVSAAPQGFNAELGLEDAVTASANPASLGYVKELFSAPIPDLGISIPHVFELGGIISYDVGFNTSIQGQAKFDFGIKSTLPDSAQAVLGVVGDKQSSADGFQGGADPFFTVDEISAGVSVTACSKPKVSFGIDVTGVGKADVALAVQLPQVVATLTTKYAANGACPDDSKHTTTGVDLSLQAGVVVDAEVDAAFGKNADNELPKWSKTLYSKTWDLAGKCIPIAIPGLQPSQSAAPSVSLSSIASSGLPFTARPSASAPTGRPVISRGSSLYYASSFGNPTSYGTGVRPQTTKVQPSGGGASTRRPVSGGGSSYFPSSRGNPTAPSYGTATAHSLPSGGYGTSTTLFGSVASVASTIHSSPNQSFASTNQGFSSPSRGFSSISQVTSSGSDAASTTSAESSSVTSKATTKSSSSTTARATSLSPSNIKFRH